MPRRKYNFLPTAGEEELGYLIREMRRRGFSVKRNRPSGTSSPDKSSDISPYNLAVAIMGFASKNPTPDYVMKALLALQYMDAQRNPNQGIDGVVRNFAAEIGRNANGLSEGLRAKLTQAVNYTSPAQYSNTPHPIGPFTQSKY